jgi:RNA polymerase sigma-70 factor (ECF subfamily)
MEDLDRITIQHAIKGDNRAFKAIYDHYSPFIWRVLFKMVSGDRNLAEELLQETFVKIHYALKTFRAESSFATWAYRIAYNVTLHSVAKRKKHSVLTACDDQIADNHRSDHYEDSEMVHKLLKELSHEDRFLLVAKEVDDFSYDDLSEITNISAGALRTRLHRLKENIRNRLVKIFPEANLK